MLDEALSRLAHVEAVMVNFDIDVLDRGQMPAAPGARPGGMAIGDFFKAARMLAAYPQVRLVDLTEFDPALNVSDIGAPTTGGRVCEVLAGFSERGRAPSPLRGEGWGGGSISG